MIIKDQSEDDIESYSKYVAQLAQLKSDVLISNGVAQHARVLVSNMLLHAQEKIRIFSSSLNPEIYEHESTIEALKTLLSKKDTKLEILLQDREKFKSLEELKAHQFVQICMGGNEGDSNSSKCEIKIASDLDAQLKEHFVIMDSEGYRFCPDKNKTSAIATFYRPFTATNLIKQFDILFSRSIPVETLSTSSLPA
jgi:hypothetical protein